VNEEVAVRLENHWGYIRQHEQKFDKTAWAGEVANVWKALTVLLSLLAAALGWMFHEIIAIDKVLAVCCAAAGVPK